jgi:hypothetical protein
MQSRRQADRPGYGGDDMALAQVLDPYGVLNDLPEEADCVGWAYFVRAPNSDIWVNTHDLPEATCREFWRLLA